MKLKNKLLPIVALSGIATIAMPLVASCNNGGDTPKVDVEWNEEYGSFLDVFYNMGSGNVNYRQIKWHFSKVIMSEEISKNIDDYDVYFINTKTGELFDYIYQKESYLIPNINDNKYLDLHISCVDLSLMPVPEWQKIVWSVTIRIVHKGTIVFSKPIFLDEICDYVDKWNPSVEKTVSFSPTTGKYMCDSAIAVPSEQSEWTYAWLVDPEGGEIIKYVEDDPYPFVLKGEVGDNNIYTLSGQWDRLIDVHEPVIFSLEAGCHSPSWEYSTIIRVQDITFVPQE